MPLAYNSKRFNKGAQWAEPDGNTLTIIKTHPYYDLPVDEDFNVVCLDQNGVRWACGYRALKDTCNYVGNKHSKDV